MPSDASIYSLIRPSQPPPDPMQQYAQMQQIGHLMDTGKLNDLQRQQLEGSIADDKATAQAYRDAGGDPSKVGGLLYGRGLYKPAIAADKARLENEKARGEIDHKKIETVGKAVAIYRDQLAAVGNPQEAAQWIMAGYNDPNLSPILQRAGSPQERIARIPQDPQGFEEWKRKNGAGIEKYLEMTAPKATLADTGAALVPTQTNPLAAGGVAPIAGAAAIPKTQTPESVASNATTQRGQDLTDARAREQADRDKFSAPFESTVAGQPRLVVQNKVTGEILDANSRQPLAGAAGPKVGESAQKQQVGVASTKSAIAEYREALKKWGAADIASPDARAKMGTVYNNMLLQAKEAYNLGVLNGPDYQILQEVITNPASIKGGITSKAALDEQASQLDAIMSKIGGQITATQSGQQAPAAPKAIQVKTFNSLPDPAQFSGKRMRADDGTIYRSNGTSWQRI